MRSSRTRRSTTLTLLALAISIAPVTQARETEGARDRLTVPPPPLIVLVTVGSDADCDFDDLDDAIDYLQQFGTDQHVLRIARNYAHPVRSTVYNRSLYFEGGYATCSSAERSGRTELEGVGTDNLFDFVETDGGTYEMVLDGLSLSGGGGFVGGAVIAIGDGMTLRVRGTEIHDNVVADRGGGVFVSDASLILEDGTTVLQNQALDGGGVYCEDGSVELHSGTIAFNQALQGEGAQVAQGGGIFALRCRVESSAGGPFAGIILNSAQSGGGIFATLSNVLLQGTSTHPATVFSNTGGGGISAASSSISAKNASISGNVGHGIHLADSTLLVDRADACHDDDRCSQISGNSGDGVVVLDSFAAILQTYIEDNGSAIRVIDTNGSATLILSNSVLANNSPSGGPAILANLGDLSLHQSTIIGERSDRALIAGVVTSLDLRNTLLWRRSPAGVGAPVFPILAQGAVELDCGIFDSTANPPENVTGIRVFEQDPSFVDLAGGDYHLRSDSPAIDRCEPLSPPERDIDRQERGHDIAGLGDPPFPDDIGADEFHFTLIEGPSPSIFADGFESGDLSAWLGGG